MSEYPPSKNSGNRALPPHPGLDLVRATEAAALAAGRFMGLADRHGADHAAQDAMAAALDLLPMKGHIICGEEGRHGGHSPLDSQSKVGTGKGPELDVEVNAIDGAGLVADGKSGALSVAAFAPPGALWRPGPAVYMDKLVVDREVAESIGPEVLDAPPGWTLATVARSKGKDVNDVVVFIVDRPRHKQLIHDVRQAGARVFLRTGGDVAGALLAADVTAPVDLMMGIGGAAEGLMAACAVKALGGAMLGRITPQSQNERQACLDGSVDLEQVHSCEDMVQGDEVYFSATGITDGLLLHGVRYHGDYVDTHSMVLRYETGTRRIIKTEHRVK
ncbi:MAG: fructose-bisphosphatase class II family protein [Candidatus Krumholzibacteriota bacterium]